MSDVVGYQRPPRHSQFKPGQSGNPSGRRKRGPSFGADLEEELSQLMRVRDGDREITITKQRALVRALVQTAMKGDARALGTIISLCERLSANHGGQVDAPEDAAILKATKTRTRLNEASEAPTENNDA